MPGEETANSACKIAGMTTNILEPKTNLIWIIF